VCGCTDTHACKGGCHWVPDPEHLDALCSACLPHIGPPADPSQLARLRRLTADLPQILWWLAGDPQDPGELGAGLWPVHDLGSGDLPVAYVADRDIGQAICNALQALSENGFDPGDWDHPGRCPCGSPLPPQSAWHDAGRVWAHIRCPTCQTSYVYEDDYIAIYPNDGEPCPCEEEAATTPTSEPGPIDGGRGD